MEAIAVIAIFVLVTGGLGLWLVDDRVVSRLRVSHPDVWHALGPPNKVLDDWGMTYTWAVEEFCRKPEFQSTCDAEMVKLAVFARMYHRICGAVAALALVALGFVIGNIT